MSTAVTHIVAGVDDRVASVNIMHDPVRPSSYFRWYTVWQRPVAAALLLALAPILLIIVVLVRLTSKGSALYCQSRVGRDGRIFKIYKLRSMFVDAEARTGAVWTTNTDDPRITPIGRFLRASHLDELPQLWNIVRGEMALVGPRPERPEFVEHLRKVVPGYIERLRVLPGVTGLAQVNLPADSDIDSVRRKIVLDVRYIARGSFLFDIRLLFATTLPLVGIRSDYAARLVGVVHSADPQLASNGAVVGMRRSGSHSSRAAAYSCESLSGERDCHVITSDN